MTNKLTTSNEVISINARRDLGPLIEKILVPLREEITKNNTVSKKYFEQISEVLTDYLGLKIKVIFLPTVNADAAVLTNFVMGHTGSKVTDGRQITETEKGLNDLIKIDMEKLKFSGALVNDFNYTIGVSYGIVSDIYGFTIPQVAAIILHEVGHCISTLTTLGDYVYLNYALSEGIDILLNKKVNKYNVKIIDQTWIKNNIPKDDWEKYINEPSEDTAKVVILSAYKSLPNTHLTETKTSLKRDEQLADNFVSRLGYGRELALALTNIERLHRNTSFNSKQQIFIESIKSAFYLGLSPLVIATIIASPNQLDPRYNVKYDPIRQRLMKIKNDLVAQLRYVKDTELKPGIDKDIYVIDNLIADLNSNETIFVKLINFINPFHRKVEQLTKLEDTLEELLNNDLFVKAYRLSE